MNIFTKQKQTHRHRKQTSLPKRKGGGEGINQEFGSNIYILLYTKQINNKHPLYSTGNYTQPFVITHMGKKSEKIYTYVNIYEYICICICITESLYCTPETNTTL